MRLDFEIGDGCEGLRCHPGNHRSGAKIESPWSERPSPDWLVNATSEGTADACRYPWCGGVGLPVRGARLAKL